MGTVVLVVMVLARACQMTSTSAQFATMEACEAARARLVQQLTADNPGAWKVAAVCAPRG